MLFVSTVSVVTDDIGWSAVCGSDRRPSLTHGWHSELGVLYWVALGMYRLF